MPDTNPPRPADGFLDALGAIVGKLFGARLPERALRIGSAVLFFVFGIILIVTSI